ncbi:MAG: Asp-tRNA(Asn)/Glu-tRNA(Gln) amidotransferase subunit GatB [Actinobacteria bacterium]|nr:Asp-tRNA(Asn)/Glu-tRNA(Gln) amidotransferase subunit GatB [Actinomycetota bacterium]MBW3650553.1 Asp-tRNA(Asn)/Glu-tRNA(Gln) amidotransferase subunit GatB [Actinomycetota bacterium]
MSEREASGAGALDGARYEIVVGLEVHCELRTRTKLFCGCPNSFGDEPNTNICPVCLGLPGSLPVLNRQAVEYAMRIGEALHCQVRPSIFHRKNYFYPDMPKDYQVSQYDEPINVEGWLELPAGKRIGITRAHMEEDTGKSTHMGGAGRIGDATHSLVDYNRAGVPLVEIVSEPDIRSADEARAYVSELRAILVATGASDGKMEEGSLRVDANVSVRPAHSATFGTRCEIKNMNSLRSLGRAIDYEAARQVDVLQAGGRVVQETRHWNEDEGRTSSMRSKEEAYDYRYFPEPDLVPLVPDEAWRESARCALPPMPGERRRALAEAAGTDPASVALLVELDLDGLVVEAVAAGADARIALNRAANEVAADLEGARRLSPASFAKVVSMEAAAKLTATQAKQVLAALLAGESDDPEAIAARRGFEAMDTTALEIVIDEVIAANPEPWERFKGGDPKVAGLFVGQVMKRTKGKADGKAVTSILRERAGGG